MYRHGGREAIHAMVGPKPTEGLENSGRPAQKAIRVPGSALDGRVADFSNSLSLTPEGPADERNVRLQNSLALQSLKAGRCRHDGASACVRAEGVLTQPAPYAGAESWRLSAPLDVVIEDSCAKNRYSYFLDARPFWFKIPVPH